MKIVCKTCGKKFHYEKNMGICPGCSHYTKPEGIDWINTKEESAGELWKKRVGIFLIIALAAALVISPQIFKKIRNKEINRLYQAQKVTKIPKEQLELGKEYRIQYYTFSLKTPRIFEYKGIQAPKGWNYVEIPYEAEYNSNSDEKNAGERCRPYVLADGIFYSPSYTEDLTEDEELAEELFDSDISYDDIEEGKNRWVFLLPEDAKETIFYMAVRDSIEDKRYSRRKNWTKKVYLFDIVLKGEDGNET